MPASTTRVTPLATSCSRSASISGTSGRETATASTQPRRFDASASASGPHSVGVLRGDAGRDEVGDEAGDGAADRVGGRAADGDAEAHRAASSARARRCRAARATTTMNFSTPSSSSTAVTSSKSTPTRGERVEHRAGVGVGAGDGVAGDLAVVEGRLERLLGHRVDGARGDELGDVEGVGQRRVLDAGRRPQRTLAVGAGIEQRRGAVGAELLLVQLVGEAGVRDAGLALQRERLVGADRGEALVDLGVDARHEERRDRVDRARGRCPRPWPARGRRGRRR